ncbi:MAG TPA: MFS transporter [Stellaceae bacterium]|nr:MFS transporter [Stellaceae bacterium]
MAEPAVTPDLANKGGAAAASAEESTAFAGKASRPWIMTAAVICIFMTAIEGTVVATAMPTIVSQLGDFHLFSWVFSAYFLTQSVSIPLSGRFADLFGRKPLLFFGLTLFLFGSSACGLAPNMLTLICFRIVQGIGAGCVMPVTQTLISDIYPPAVRARIQGYLSSIWATAAICGPLMGAVLVTQLSWRWIFWINVPLGIAAFVLLATFLHEQRARRNHQIDYLGTILMIAGIGLVMFALNQATSFGLTMFLGLLAVAIMLLALLYRHEQRAAEPMMPLQVWRNPIVLAATFACFTVGAITIAASAFLPAYVQGVMGETPLIAGYVVSVTSVTWMVGSAAGSKIMLRSSYRAATTIGSAIVIVGAVFLITLSPGRGPLWAGAGTALTGLGMGLFQNTFFLAAQAAVGRDQRGTATASTLFARILGQSVGSALFGGIVNLGLADRIGGNAVDKVMDPALRDNFPAAELGPLMAAIAAALHNVYLVTGLLALAGLAVTRALPRGLSPTNAARDR